MSCDHTIEEMAAAIPPVEICRACDAIRIAALLEAAKEALRMYQEVQPAGGWQGVEEGLIEAIGAMEKTDESGCN